MSGASPEVVVVVDENKALTFTEKLKNSPVSDIKVLSGALSLEYVATLDNVDSVMAQSLVRRLVAYSCSGKGGQNNFISQ